MGSNRQEPEYSASAASLTPRLACPECGRDLVRVQRHLSDRLLSVFWPRQRYRCRMHDCNWEGCLRVPATGPGRKPSR